MAAAATSRPKRPRQDLPPKTPARTAPAKDHPPSKSKARRGRGRGGVSSPDWRVRDARRPKGGGARSKKGGGTSQKEGVNRGWTVGLSSARGLSSCLWSLSSCLWSLSSCLWSLSSCLWSFSSTLWASARHLDTTAGHFSLARSGYTCRGARHEPSDHAGERLGVRGEATRDDDAIRKVATSFSFSLGFV